MVVVYGQSYDFLIWFFLSAIFLILAFKNFFRPSLGQRHKFDLKVCFYLFFTVFFAYFPISKFLFENKMSKAVKVVTGYSPIFFCQGLVDSMFNKSALGFVDLSQNKLYLTYSTCKFLKSYVEDPNDANMSEIIAVHVLSHEAAHVMGFLDEKRTECVAFQKNHEFFRSLGANKDNSEVYALMAYKNIPNPKNINYYSKECRPGGALDQKYPNAIWQKVVEK